jgi:eukaryotic-like serine/threonine-protein kinase
MPRPGDGPPQEPDSRTPTLESTTAPTRLPQLGPGAVVASYRLEKELGRGAAGVVFAARHARTGALVALKLLPRDGRKGSGERFEREVQALAKLQHPNVVTIHEAGETGSLRWYTMDLVDGEPLDRVLSGKRDLAERVKLLVQVARGMEHAHARGLVHRDLKPPNVLVTREGVARVSDFGIAKHLDRATRLTEQGAMLGTIHYMAPEQCADSAHLDGRADVWSVGVMLFEAATGQVPWNGDTAITIVTRICSDPTPRPRSLAPDLSPDLEAVIVRALEKDPALRYPTMAALAADLERYVRGEPVSASRVTFRRQIVRRYGVRSLALGGLLVAALASTLLVLVQRLLRARSELAASTLRTAIRSRADAIEQRSTEAL